MLNATIASGRRALTLSTAGLIAVAGLLSACTAKSGDPAPLPAPAVTSPGGSGSAAEVREIECTAGEAHVRTEFPAGPDDLVAGSVSWPGLRGWATADPADVGDAGSADRKIGAVIRAGQVVTVAVADDSAGLNYGQAWGYSPAHAVTFHGCADSDTAYIGGFHVAGRRCVRLIITEEGRAPTPVTVSFFAGNCASAQVSR
ncbi:hypothetical protein [Actinoplanes sp. NPDC026619]|uniref:hypothetical protein n=1 Tax=Actinoplanes sp. NPDC026619 TaxID=3155798 RepID=UPI0033D4056A